MIIKNVKIGKRGGLLLRGKNGRWGYVKSDVVQSYLEGIHGKKYGYTIWKRIEKVWCPRTKSQNTHCMYRIEEAEEEEEEEEERKSVGSDEEEEEEEEEEAKSGGDTQGMRAQYRPRRDKRSIDSIERVIGQSVYKNSFTVEVVAIGPRAKPTRLIAKRSDRGRYEYFVNIAHRQQYGIRVGNMHATQRANATIEIDGQIMVSIV